MAKPNTTPSLLHRAADISPRAIGRAVGDGLFSLMRDRATARAMDELRPVLMRELRGLVQLQFQEHGPAETSPLEGLLSVQTTDQAVAEAMINAYMSHPILARCVTLLASSLAQVPLRFYKAGAVVDGKEELKPWDDHPVARAFEWANEQESEFEFWEGLIGFLILCGRSYVLQGDPSRGAPTGIPFEPVALFPQFVQPVLSPTRGVLGYRYKGHGSVPMQYEPEQIISLRTWSPVSRFSGLPRGFPAFGTLATDQLARQLNKRMLTHGVHLGMVLSNTNPDADIQVEQAVATKEAFAASFQGIKNALGVAALWGGWDAKPLGLVHKDISWLEQIGLNTEELSIVFGIPLELIGAKAANYATMREKRRIFWEDSAPEWGRRIEHSLERKLRKIEPSIRVRYDYSAVPALQPDRNQLTIAGEQAIRSGQYTVNEWRQRFLGLPPVEGGDVLMIGRGLIPLDQAILGDEAKPEDPALPVADEDQDEEDREEKQSARHSVRLIAPSRARMLERIVQRTPHVVVLARKSPKQWRRSTESIRDHAEKSMELGLRGGLRAIEGEVVGIVKSATNNANKLSDIERVLLIDGRKEIVSISRTAITDAMVKQGTAALRMAGLRGSFDIRNPHAEQRLAKQGRRIVDMMGREWVDLRGELVKGMQAGLPEQELAKVVNIFFEGERSNAITVARTELAPAVNGSTYEAMEQASREDIDVVLEWFNAGDGNVRGNEPNAKFDHVRAQGLTIRPNRAEFFVVSGEQLLYPGDFEHGASAGNTIGCRCAVVPGIEERAA